MFKRITFFLVLSGFLFAAEKTSSQCDDDIFPLDQKMTTHDFKIWMIKNTSIKDNYYHGQAGPKEVEDHRLQTDAEGDLARTISVNIVGELEARFREENFEVQKNTLIDNINSYFSTKLRNTKKIIVEDESKGYTIHLFKCKDEVDSDKIEYNKEFSKRVNDYLNEYESEIKKKNISYAFRPLCKAYLLAKSTIIPIVEESKAQQKMDEYLGNILIEFEPEKIPDCRPGIRVLVDPEVSVTYGDYQNRVPMKSFQLIAKFSKGGNDWRDQKENFTLDRNGKSQIDLGIIESATQNQKVFIYPDTSGFFKDKDFPISNASKRALVKELDGVFKKRKTLEVSLSDKFKIRFTDDSYYLKCPEWLKPQIYDAVQKSLASSEDYELSEEDNINIYELRVTVKEEKVRGSYKVSAELSLSNGEDIGKASLDISPDDMRKDFSELLKKLNDSAYTSKVSYRLARKDVTIEIKDDRRADFEKSKGLSGDFIVNNGQVRFKFLYKGEVFKSVAEYISGDIELNDWFKNKPIDFHPGKTRYYYEITNDIKQGILLSWKRKKPGLWNFLWQNRKSEKWSLLSGGFETLKSPIEEENTFEYKLTVIKDGWEKESWRIKPDLMKKKHPIKSITMEKVDLKAIKIMELALVPGVGQRELYRTKFLRQIESYIYHVLTLYYAYSAYSLYQDYEVAKGKYFENKNNYESLYDSDDPELFDYYHEKAENYNSQMTHSFDRFRIHAMGLGVVYVINLAEVFYSVKKFK
jgi:hypothetical protein